MKRISNERITVEIDEHGAELTSIKCNGREYLWGAHPEFWKRHSPVLFPIVGSVWNGEFRSKCKTFKMGQHGFARDMDFSPLSLSSNEAWFVLESNEETLAKYPYQFILRIGYAIHGNTIDVCWEVENPSNEEIYFQIGAHPAFYWPLLSNAAIESGVEAMNSELQKVSERGYFKLSPNRQSIKCSVLKDGGVDPNIEKIIDLNDGYLAIDTDTFNDDALIIENSQTDTVTLCDANKAPYLTVKFDAPLVGLWSTPHKNAPFVCIEPWYGRADSKNYTGPFEQKPWTNSLSPHTTFRTHYQILLP